MKKNNPIQSPSVSMTNPHETTYCEGLLLGRPIPYPQDPVTRCACERRYDALVGTSL